MSPTSRRGQDELHAQRWAMGTKGGPRCVPAVCGGGTVCGDESILAAKFFNWEQKEDLLLFHNSEQKEDPLSFQKVEQKEDLISFQNMEQKEDLLSFTRRAR